jgi:hypothetical protein
MGNAIISRDAVSSPCDGLQKLLPALGVGHALWLSSASVGAGASRRRTSALDVLEYSRAGDLLKASVSAHSFVLSIARQTGQVADLDEHIPEVVTISQPGSSIVPCQLVVSATSDRAALAIPTANGIILELIDLTTGKLSQMVRVPNKFPIQFSLHPVGFVDESSQLAVSQAHYLPTGEPEVATALVSSDGSITSVPHNVLGAQYTEGFVVVVRFPWWPRLVSLPRLLR